MKDEKVKKEVKKEKKEDLSATVAYVARRLDKVVKWLEAIHGSDIDGDGKVGFARIGTMILVGACALAVGVGFVFAAEDIANWSQDSGLTGNARIEHDGSSTYTLIIDTVAVSNDLTIADDLTVTGDLTVSGAASLGANEAVVTTVGTLRVGKDLVVTNGVDASSYTVDANAGIDTQAAGTLKVGAATATRVEIADQAVTTDVEGPLSVAEELTSVGTLRVTSIVVIAENIPFTDPSVQGQFYKTAAGTLKVSL